MSSRARLGLLIPIPDMAHFDLLLLIRSPVCLNPTAPALGIARCDSFLLVLDYAAFDSFMLPRSFS